MTGEMSQFNAEHDEAWDFHRRLARALKGKIRAFDVYQGPYISVNGGRVWVSYGADPSFPTIVWDRQGNAPVESEPFHWKDIRTAAKLARDLMS